MHFVELALPGAFVITQTRHDDERGFFARTFCEETLARRGLVSRYRQSSVSFNRRLGTLRGLHFAAAPHNETKIVRCTSGAIYDVIVDLRRSSPTFLCSVGITLTAENGEALYIPGSFAHGFQTLEDATEVLYMIDQNYVSEAARGLRWNDPVLGIKWPKPIMVISERDRLYSDWQREASFP